MRRYFPSLIALFLFVLLHASFTFGQNDKQNLRMVIHLLGYVARDYPNAVHQGSIIDAGEFKEQQEFSLQIYRLTKSANFLPDSATMILPQMKTLTQAINAKKEPSKIAQIARNIRGQIIQITGVSTAPQVWPDVNKGKELYAINCASCHGEKGDGKGDLAANLSPKPANFIDTQLMQQVSPFQAYNTIRLGVEGTSMPSFSALKEAQIWALAFYVKSLRFQSNENDTTSLRKKFEAYYPKLGLKTITVSNDVDLLDSLSKKTNDSTIALAALRLLSPTNGQVKNSLSIAQAKLQLTLQAYQKGDIKSARNLALQAYLEGIEPVEAQLRSINSGFVSQLEGKMFAVRQLIEKGAQMSELKASINSASTTIDHAESLIQNQHLNYWLSFLIAASIVLREGMEAFLVLAVILALIQGSGVRKALPWLHSGWILAVIMGVAGWFLSDYIIQFGGKNREIMEGLVSLLAVIVLLFVGFWLHKNTQAQKWKVFVNERIGGYLQKDKMFGLAAFSFMVVFREAFEVILFLQAIKLETAPGNKSAIGLGVLAAAACIGIIAVLFLKYAKRIPIRQLFRYSSWLIILLAIILMGKGIHSLQESGWITMNGLVFIRVDWLGIYPTIETIVGQAILIFIMGLSFLRKKG